VRSKITADEPRGARPDAVLIDRGFGRFPQGRLRGETEVIVRGES
jgi:hypothetical protein